MSLIVVTSMAPKCSSKMEGKLLYSCAQLDNIYTQILKALLRLIDITLLLGWWKFHLMWQIKESVVKLIKCKQSYCLWYRLFLKWVLSLVNIFSECSDGFYGMGCAQRCVCTNGGKCHHLTGDCNCTAGWTGMACERGVYN